MHQLDFNVTIYSEDEDLLLALEQVLALPGAGCLIVGDALARYANCIGGKIEKIEVAGVDINWDESKEDVKEDPVKLFWKERQNKVLNAFDEYRLKIPNADLNTVIRWVATDLKLGTNDVWAVLNENRRT